MIAAAVAGAWLGAGVVAGWPRRRDPDRDGVALLGGGVLLRDDATCDSVPGGGDTLGLQAPLLVGAASPATSCSAR